MTIVVIVIIVVVVLCLIGKFAPDDSSTSNNYTNTQQNNTPQRTPPPHYRNWNGVEINGGEVRCGWCKYLRDEKETGKIYCSRYPGYVDEHCVCDSYENGIEALAEGLANIFKDK